MNIARVILRGLEIAQKVFQHFVVSPLNCLSFGECGRNVKIGSRFSVCGREHLKVGNRVSVGADCLILCTKADCIIGDNVMFGPRVTVITGNHTINILGKLMYDVSDKDKAAEDDMPVVFMGDNWIGANTTILKGVIIGEGAVVAAGAVVTKNVAPYTVVGGIPAQKINDRFGVNDIEKHRKMIMDLRRISS